MQQLDSVNLARRLQAVFNTVIDGVITIDRHGIIESVNPAAASLFDYHANELIGNNISMLMPPPYQKEHDGYLKRYAETKIPKIIGIGREVEGKKKNGVVFPMRLAVSELQLENGEIIFTGIIHDLSDVKNAEKALVELNQHLEKTIEQRTVKLNEVINKLLDLNKKYEGEIDHRKKVEEALLKNEIKLKKMLDREKELNELKSRFLSMASHEFKTPLSTILSSASLIRKYSLEEHMQKREKHIDRIKGSVQHLDAILNDFLSLSKLEENKIKVKKEPIAFSELCQKISEELKEQFKPGQRLNHHCEPSELIFVTDEMILKNILFNLISNATKYSGENQPINCHCREDEKYIEISISDQGMGIPEEEQKHLFTRFFRASNAINIKGTGLGLHIVREYLDLLGGTISFTSMQGKGSTFKIKLAK